MRFNVSAEEEAVMFRFEREQRECEIGGVRFGGQPGRYATVLAPSIFQKGDRVF
ncbi:MAG: hypothetical protein ACP5M0_15010, partial [Desulfomonilaceae bacterium]